MKPQAPQRPTSSLLSPAAILASLRAANSVTPNAGMSRPKSIQRGLVNKFESSAQFENYRISTEPSVVTIKQNNEKKNGEDSPEFSAEISKPFIEMKKGILIRKKEKSVILMNSVPKVSEEEKRRASVLRLFSDPPNDPADTSVIKEEKDKTLQSIKGTQDFVEEYRSSPFLPGYSFDSKKRKKVSFIFNPDSPEVPERSGSSRTNRLNRNTKSSLHNDRIAITAAKNRALQLIAENIKPSPNIVSEGLTFGVGCKNNDKSPIMQMRDIRVPSRERENIRIPTPNAVGRESQAPMEARDTPSDQKQNETMVKKNIFVQLPMISTPIIKLNEELTNTLTAGKYIGNSSIKNEGYPSTFSFPEAPKIRGGLGHSSSVTALGGSKMSNPYSFHVDRLRKKENSINISSDSRGKMNTQPDSSMNRGLSIDIEKSIIEAKEEHKKKLLSLLRKQQIPL